MIEIFTISFLVALTGALSPGPLLTFTIYKSIKQKRGYISAIFILLGHATIELSLIIGLLAGALFFFSEYYLPDNSRSDWWHISSSIWYSCSKRCI